MTGKIKNGTDNNYNLFNAFLSSEYNTNLVSKKLTKSTTFGIGLNLDCLFKVETL